MTHDKPAAVGAETPAAVRFIFTGIGVLAGLGLVALVALFISLKVQQHGYDETTQKNMTTATSEASANAQAFYQSLRTTAESESLTSSEVRALAQRSHVITRPPATHDGSVVVEFGAFESYVEAGTFEGGDETVRLCYIATLPLAPATTPGATLREVSCPTSFA
jgi:hypothetical protein